MTMRNNPFIFLHPLIFVHRKNARQYRLLKDQAHMLVLQRIDQLNAHYGFQIGRISIRNQKTRWGSCSKTGNISFNYKIALLSPDLCDYVIVHELCHLKEFNHKKEFWDLVGQTIPDYKQRRAYLKARRQMS